MKSDLNPESQDEEGGEESGSDFENEIHGLIESGSEDGDVPFVMTAHDDVPVVMTADETAEETDFEQVLVPNETCVITEVISSPIKRISMTQLAAQGSQVLNPT
ncbi:hypothetical protein D1007_59044 [Hordeum vulgare]|nr:hypothetical protein D1007_59044 [Hordeum vulgare]